MAWLVAAVPAPVPPVTVDAGISQRPHRPVCFGCRHSLLAVGPCHSPPATAACAFPSTWIHGPQPCPHNTAFTISAIPQRRYGRVYAGGSPETRAPPRQGPVDPGGDTAFPGNTLSIPTVGGAHSDLLGIRSLPNPMRIPGALAVGSVCPDRAPAALARHPGRTRVHGALRLYWRQVCRWRDRP